MIIVFTLLSYFMCIISYSCFLCNFYKHFSKVLIVNPGNNGERLNRSQLSAQSESQEESDDTAPFQLSKPRSEDLMRRARNAERKRRWRLSLQAVETPEEAASRRAQHAEEVRLWRKSRLTNERREGTASCRLQQTAPFCREHTARRPFVSGNRTFVEKQVVLHNDTL